MFSRGRTVYVSETTKHKPRDVHRHLQISSTTQAMRHLRLLILHRRTFAMPFRRPHFVDCRPSVRLSVKTSYLTCSFVVGQINYSLFLSMAKFNGPRCTFRVCIQSTAKHKKKILQWAERLPVCSWKWKKNSILTSAFVCVCVCVCLSVCLCAAE